MIDFSRLAQAAGRSDSDSLFDTFARLDRKVSHVELRPSQLALFKKIDERLDQQDLVVKLNTGGGKTTTGLIYLKHMMDRYSEPVVFLVPTVQLADQIIEEGSRIGLRVVAWAGGQTYPPEQAVQCEAILVCTYDKFFNGKSTFGRSDVRLIPCAIVLDDVHAGVESVKKCFSAEIPAEARIELIELLGHSLNSVEPGNWTRVKQEDPNGILEVPHWVFAEHLAGVRAILSRYARSDGLVFSWAYLSRALELCRLVISGTAAAIALDPPVVEYVEHYTRAKHRLFMSASIHDGATLVRELACDEIAATSPVEVDGEAAVGERMVVVPSLADPSFTREQLLQVVSRFIADTNVVVLVSSDAAARFWTANGAVNASGEHFGQYVSKLKREQSGNFVVFVNRYDGVDLPDSACRVLVIDGLPAGEGIVDRLDNENAGGLVGMRGKLANRVEQGLGRAVRSNSDYCAVILAGQDLANFVSRKAVLENFSASTVRQIEMGREVSKAISSDPDKVNGLVGAIGQLLGRDEGWRTYYSSQMKVKSEASERVFLEAQQRREVAAAERRSIVAALTRDYSGAARMLRNASNLLERHRLSRGVLKQSAAKLLYYAEKVAAMDLQASAYADNYNLSRPPVMPSTSQRRVSDQANQIATWLQQFEDKNGALLELDALASRLTFSNEAETVESAMLELGAILGADSRRPEREDGRGPDNLWVFGDVAFCIEMKSEKFSKLWKSDGAQIALSERWVRDAYSGLTDLFPIIGSDVNVADCVDDFGAGVRVITQEGLLDVVSRFRGMVVGLITQGRLFSEDPASVQKQLGPHGLLPKQLVQGCVAIK